MGWSSQIEAILARLGPAERVSAEKLLAAGQKGDLSAAEAVVHNKVFNTNPALRTTEDRIAETLPGKTMNTESGQAISQLPQYHPTYEQSKAALMMGGLAVPTAGMNVQNEMNPLRPLGYMAQKYQDAKDSILSKFAEQTDLTPGGAPDYRANAKMAAGAVLDPANVLPGAGAIVAPIAEQALASQSPNQYKASDFHGSEE